MLHNSERMYKSVVMGDMNGREGRNASRQKCGKQESTGMSLDVDERGGEEAQLGVERTDDPLIRIKFKSV